MTSEMAPDPEATRTALARFGQSGMTGGDLGEAALLLAALPSEPTTSKLAQIRKYAADEIFKRSPLAYDLDGEKGLFHQLSLYAAQVVGLASGFRVPKAGEVLLLGTGAPAGSERQECKCGWCNCYACEAVGRWRKAARVLYGPRWFTGRHLKTSKRWSDFCADHSQVVQGKSGQKPQEGQLQAGEDQGERGEAKG